MVQPLITRNIPADFLTSNHYIFGQVRVSNTGLMGLLSDPNSSGIEVNEASLARILKPDKVINFASAMWVVKEQIIAVSLNKREYVGSSSLVRGGFNRINEYLIQITTPVYEIQGTLEYAGRFEFPAILGDGTNDFLVLYDATLTAALFPAMHQEAQAILINRKFIDSLVNIKKAS